jgi:hypothetical protein
MLEQAGYSFVEPYLEENMVWKGGVPHRVIKDIKAKMKLSVLQDNGHTNEEKEKRLKQTDIDIHHTKEMMKNDLEYRGLLMP